MIEVQVYKGVNFRKYEGRRYFECGPGAAKRLGSSALHRVIWMDEKGPIPKGMHIHHKNHDPLDNRIENLELVNKTAHYSHHYHDRAGTEKALHAGLAKWMGTEKGRAVRRDAMQKCRERMPFKLRVCVCCKGIFGAKHYKKKYCSSHCVTIGEREGTKVKGCEVCGAEIKVKSHSTRETRTCGYTCGWALRRLKASKPQGENIYAS